MTARQEAPLNDSAAGLVGDVLVGFTRLVKGELDLARVEAKRSLRDAAKALATLAFAGILVITAVNVLCGAAISALVRFGMPPMWASVSVGGGLLLIAAGLAFYARHLLSADNLSPNRSFHNLRRDAETLKSMVNPGARSDL